MIGMGMHLQLSLKSLSECKLFQIFFKTFLPERIQKYVFHGCVFPTINISLLSFISVLLLTDAQCNPP